MLVVVGHVNTLDAFSLELIFTTHKSDMAHSIYQSIIIYEHH